MPKVSDGFSPERIAQIFKIATSKADTNKDGKLSKAEKAKRDEIAEAISKKKSIFGFKKR